MQERDNMIKKHPKTQFVVAHMSWYANDLGKALEDDGRDAEHVHGGRRGVVRHRPSAAERSTISS
jgi:hypothetical protein